MYYGGYYGMYWDPTYILVIIGMVICLLASARVKSTYAKFNRVRSHSGITAAEAAEKILHGAGIYDVEIRHISGDLTDNYVTLPVEFNASSRALKILGNSHILYDDEISGARKVLTAAALTYVAAAASSILQLLRLLLLFGDRRDD